MWRDRLAILHGALLAADSAMRDPRLNPQRGDYFIAGPRRHVRVESVTQSLDRGAIVHVCVVNPVTRAHYLDAWSLDWFLREVRWATVGGA